MIAWITKGIGVIALFAVCGVANAGQPALPPALEGVAEREMQRQQEQERLRQQQIEDAQPDVRIQPDIEAPSSLEYPDSEDPCFLIREIRLEGERADTFKWALKPVDDAIGRCLGSKGINVVLARVQNAILEKGYTTTRIVAAPQDIKTGVLVLKVVPGTISEIVLAEGSGRWIHLVPVLPLRKGKILNIRDVEQGLENLRRIPTVQTDIKLVPGENEGESTIEVQRTQGRFARVSFSTDDSGSRATGKNQGNATLYLDNLLGMSDMFYASYGGNLEHRNKPHGTETYSLYYSIPWGYWQLNVFHNNHDYHQMVAGYNTNYEYSGESQNTSVELSRVIRRTAKGKTSVSFGGYLATSHNYIDDTEMEIQRRRQGGWELGVNHRQYIKSAMLDLDFKYKRGTGAFNAIRAPEEDVDEGTSRPQIFTMNLRLTVPFQIKKQNFRFTTSWRQQHAFNKLIQRDRFSIANRYTVRGFDGEYTLSGDDGFVSRTELAYAIPKINQEIYTAFDFGRVWGPGSEWLLGQSLSGVALGLRGAIKQFSYDVFISRPVNKPDRYPGDRWVGGFSASVQF